MMHVFAVALLAAQQGSPAAPSAPAPIAPASGGGQVGQPPQNSAMRTSGSGGRQPTPVRANPMGMAGMGAGMGGGATNGLTLSAGNRSGGTGMPRAMQQQGAGQTNVRITDTGVTQRTPAAGQGRR